MLNQIHEFALLLTPIILGMMQAIKSTNLIAKENLPIVTVLVGILLSLIFIGFNLLAVEVGIVASLFGIGVYDIGKKSILRK